MRLGDDVVNAVARARLLGLSARAVGAGHHVPVWTVERIWSGASYGHVPAYHGPTRQRVSPKRFSDARADQLIDRSGGPDACWPWKGTALASGYGLWRGTTVTRWVMRREGRLVDGLFVCHRCDNPPCCNPAHLYMGTPKQNAEDAVARGRLRSGDSHWTRRVDGAQRGDRNNACKHSEGTIATIRARRAAGERVVDLSREFGIHQTYLSAICAGRARA